jgi:polyvinyl alcohol dehydrogenase (cytochrome)
MAGWKPATVVGLLSACAATAHIVATVGGGPDWSMIGNDSANSRDAPLERRIRPDNVNQLHPKWIANTTGDVSATPAVVDGAVYVDDFGGTVRKLDADTGQVIWEANVADYTGHSGDYARTSPIVAGNTLVVGVIRGTLSASNPCPDPTLDADSCPNMLGINAKTGALRWRTRIHDDPHAAMTGSPVLAGDTIVTGISANGASGANATFRAAIVALNAHTGRILWRTYSVPDNGGVSGGYAGATMFSPPSVNMALGLVYGEFGQPYHVPDSVTQCHTANDPKAGGFAESCELPGAFWKSIVAFDLRTGRPRWYYRMNRSHGLCASQPAAVTWCAPDSDGEKWDIGGSAANVMRLRMRGHWRDVVGLGAKSGAYTVLDAETGAPIWSTLIGPGGDQGGVEWGTAFDGTRIYVPITNHHHIPYKLTHNGALDMSSNITGGSWAALDPDSGTILWQTADPQIETVPGFTNVGVWDLAPVSVANGVVYAASMAKLANQNQFFALDARTGAILWQWGAGVSVNSGPSIVRGSVYWGSGYARSGVEGTGNSNKLFAFSLNGE